MKFSISASHSRAKRLTLAVRYMVGVLCHVPYNPQKSVAATTPSDKHINEIQQIKSYRTVIGV